MIIDNVYVYTADKIFVKGGIVLVGDKIMRVYEEEDAPKLTGNVIDGKGNYAIPGLIDLHFHGCKGDDVCGYHDFTRRRAGTCPQSCRRI